MKLTPARATTPNENSDSILISFDPQWVNILESKSEISFIRKRIPVSMIPKYVYIYCKAPVCAIIAKAEVSAIGFVPISEALEKSEILMMSRDEVSNYCDIQEKVGLCSLVNICVFKSPLLLSDICKMLDFNPPQSFVILGKSAVAMIDGLASYN